MAPHWQEHHGVHTARRGRGFFHPREWYAPHWQENHDVHTARKGPWFAVCFSQHHRMIMTLSY